MTIPYAPPSDWLGHLRWGLVATTPKQCNTLHHTAPHCNTLQHTATHCNTLQHTATHSGFYSSASQQKYKGGRKSHHGSVPTIVEQTCLAQDCTQNRALYLTVIYTTLLIECRALSKQNIGLFWSEYGALLITWCCTYTRTHTHHTCTYTYAHTRCNTHINTWLRYEIDKCLT